MKEARGKIIFLRRFNLTKNYESSVERAMGFNLANWDDIKYKDYKYAYKLYDDGKNHVYIQDAYNTYGSEKWPYILETMKQTTGQDTSHPIEYNSWVFNYTSCSRGAPLGLTREINPRLFKDEGNCIDNRFLGTVMLNFIDDPMARLIYETNSNLIFEPKLPTPEVEVEYGQTLAEATLKGIEDAPAGAWVFKDADHVVTDQEVTDQTKFELIFQPADNKKYKSVTMCVPVKTVKKSEVVSANATDEMEIQEIEQLQSEAIDESSSARRIVVNAEKKAKTYGEILTSEDLTFTISDSEKEKLLPGDTVDSLGLTLKATTIVQEDILSGSTTDEDGDDILGAYGNAGKYVILKDNASNSNYAILDLYDRRIVTFKISDHNDNPLVMNTFDEAVCLEPDAHPLFHSDRGFQYTSTQFCTRLKKHHMKQSMSRVAHCIDNGPMEGFWGILKREMYYCQHFNDRTTLIAAITDYIHYYNNQRLQRKLNVMTPMEYHDQYIKAA